MQANTTGPQELAALFAPFLPLAALDPSQHAQCTLAACGGGIAVPAAARSAAAAAAGNSAVAAPGVGAATAAAGPESSSPAAPAPAAPAAQAGPGGGPNLETYREEVERLRARAREVWGVCAGEVRTGEAGAGGAGLGT
jgi:hypothetical protein